MRLTNEIYAGIMRRLRSVRNANTVDPYILKYQPLGTKKIVHFNGNFVIGGTSQLIADIIEHTSDEYDHEVIVPHHPKPLPYQPISIREFPNSRLKELRRYLERTKPLLAHVHYWVREIHRHHDFAFWYTTVFNICEELNIPVIQNVNVPTYPFHSPAVVQNVFVSEFVRDEFNDAHNVPSAVIYPGSNLSHFSSDEPAPDDGAVGMVYRLDPDKLNINSIRPFIYAATQDRKLKFNIVGGGTFLEEYKKMVSDRNLDEQFCFTGYVSYAGLPEQYKKLSLVVAPVHDESFGQVTPFAMGMGIPVAGYNVGALQEILGSDETLVEPGNVEALGQRIIELMNDPGKRKELSEVNRLRAQKHFGLDNMINQYRNQYSTLISNSVNPGKS